MYSAKNNKGAEKTAHIAGWRHAV